MLPTLSQLVRAGLAPAGTPGPSTARRRFMLAAPAAALLPSPHAVAQGASRDADARPAGARESAAGTQSAGPIDSSFLEFPDERERFRALFRFERDLVDQGEALSWYHFTLFAVAPGLRPAPVVRFEGMEYSYFRRVGDLTWRIHAHNLSFPRELRTGRFTLVASNPITRRDVVVQPMALVEDPGVLHGPQGYLPLDSKRVSWFATDAVFRIEGELVKYDHSRPAPESWPVMFIESSTSAVSRRAFDDPRVTSLKYQTSGFYLFPWPAWMQMGEQPGHMLGAWSGRKLSGPGELPREFRERAEREYPQLLAARWRELDRPLPAALAGVLPSVP